MWNWIELKRVIIISNCQRWQRSRALTVSCRFCRRIITSCLLCFVHWIVHHLDGFTDRNFLFTFSIYLASFSTYFFVVVVVVVVVVNFSLFFFLLLVDVEFIMLRRIHTLIWYSRGIGSLTSNALYEPFFALFVLKYDLIECSTHASANTEAIYYGNHNNNTNNKSEKQKIKRKKKGKKKTINTLTDCNQS